MVRKLRFESVYQCVGYKGLDMKPFVTSTQFMQ